MKRELTERGIEYEEIDVERDPHLVPELLKLTGRRRIVPVLVLGTRIEVAPHGGSKF
jgi:glutaredoxin